MKNLIMLLLFLVVLKNELKAQFIVGIPKSTVDEILGHNYQIVYVDEYRTQIYELADGMLSYTFAEEYAIFSVFKPNDLAGENNSLKTFKKEFIKINNKWYCKLTSTVCERILKNNQIYFVCQLLEF